MVKTTPCPPKKIKTVIILFPLIQRPRGRIASKKAAETLCYTYHYLYDLDVTVFRYFTVYGPAGRPDMSLFRFTQWISEKHPVLVFGDGLQSRDFTYVEDIARGTIAGLTPLGYEIINLGSDTPIVLMDAIRLIVGMATTLSIREGCRSAGEVVPKQSRLRT